ncbi:MAG: alpha/beta fold hydrolase [Terricaulis sp.]
MSINWVRWKGDDRIVFSLSEKIIDPVTLQPAPGTTRILSVGVNGGRAVQMFAGEEYRFAVAAVPVNLIDLLPNDPTHVLLGTWGQRGFTLYRADINTGRVQAVEDAEFSTNDFIVDINGSPIIRQDVLPHGSGIRIYRRASGDHNWTLAYEVRRSGQVGQNRDFFPITAGPQPSTVYVAARATGQEYQAIYLYNTATGELGQPIFQAPDADAQIAWIDTQTRQFLIGCADRQRQDCHAADPQMQHHFDSLNAYFHGEADISLVGTSGSLWMLYADGPTLPPTYYVYDTESAQISLLGSAYPHISRQSLSPTNIVQYTGHDGTRLWGYLTGQTEGGPHPLVVFPHGGPEARDEFGYDFFAQFLASRGYLVFQPNFRGSEGSGRAFASAGHHQWGRAMQDDITDGVRRLVHAGIADAHKVCIVGGSYGGYAVLAGLSLTPDVYACGVSISGVSDLPQMLQWERSTNDQRTGLYEYFVSLIGDPSTARDELEAVSPARQVAHITAPLLLIHGTADDIVPVEQSQIMNRAMTAAGKSVQYDEIKDEGHIWAEWSSRDLTHMLSEVDAFLAQHIGPTAPPQTAPH